MALVSITHTESYDDELLYQAVCRHFDALHVDTDVTPDTRVLLKPNILSGRAPERAVTTHPAFLRAIARRLRELGVTQIILADSPGGVYTAASLERAYRACGYDTLTDVLTLNTDTTSAVQDDFTIIKPVLDADYVINCPKLKTHGLTVMSAAVKNLFGCMPGLLKPEQHYKNPTIESFTEMLVNLSQTIPVQLTLMDAVDCMEGNGPGGGKVRHMGYTLASRSIYDLDEAGAMLMGLHPTSIAPIIRHGRKHGLSHPDDLQWAGDALVPADPPFTLPDAYTKGERIFSINGLFHRFFGQKRTYPAILKDRCIGCGRCAESCPKHLIDIVEKTAVIARKGCISCFCCQEMCPAEAVDTVTKHPG